MTAKILTPTGKVVHRSTYRLLTPKELADSVEQVYMKAFLQMAEALWGTHLVSGQLEEVGLIDILDPQPYLDTQQTEKTFPVLEEEVTPKAGDKYIQASIMIPHGNIFACGTVFSHKCNAEGNAIGLVHDNPILDSCIFDVEFANGKVTTLTANAIAKAMYAQCYPDGNKCIFLDELIDVKHTDDALTFDQQKIIVNGTTHQCKFTKGWFICCRWKDGSTLWKK